MFSIIIPCFNGEKYIKTCLNSISKQTVKSFEIIIINDNSKDNSEKEILELGKKLNITLIKNKKNLGPSKSRNLGAKKSKGKYLVFLDVDTKLDKSFLEELLKKFEQDKKVGAIQAKLETGGHFLSFAGFPYEIKPSKKEKIIFGARSAALAVRRDVFEKVGGFDEDYLIYGEDTDISWRICLLGYRILYLPKAKVRHFQKSSLTPKTRYRLFYEGAKNNTGNILKNAPLKILIWMLPLHIAGWVLVSIKLLIQGEYKLAGNIYKGLWWNLRNLKKTLNKRRKVIKKNKCTKIMFGKINLRELLLKGWKWFRHV